MSPGRTEGWGEGVFKIWFYFSLSFSNLVINYTSFSPQVQSVLSVTEIGE